MKAIENAKRAALTNEQKNLIAQEERKVDMTAIDQNKLKEAQAIVAQIESESYSKFDDEFESKIKGGWRHEEEILTDEQLQDLFSQMKQENKEKRDREIKKFKLTRGDNNDDGDDLLQELGALEGSDDELLNAPRGLDEDEIQVEEEPPRFYNEAFKQELAAYREMKKQSTY
jgi:hypothetical protein